MKITTVENFRDNLSEMIDELIKSNEHLKVTTEMGNVAVLSESDYNGIMETLRIYSNPQEKEKKQNFIRLGKRIIIGKNRTRV
ncbi:MAG: type II toxin-antitoxin system Phd/YefM family antitoxin [Finegoldia magna]|nr:type II toxin-antitoxin system Phd/YefM family antitoxin [Finegoldia magna]